MKTTTTPTAVSQEMIAAAERKADQAEGDLSAKRVPYEADPLFMYLWERGFGTPNYRSARFARFLDRKVARLIGFEEARRNYSVLVDLPVRLREHADRLRSKARSPAPSDRDTE
jgi:hypothetical protein